MAGVAVNLAGLKPILEDVFVLKGLLLTLESLGSITTPLILIIVGYGIKFDKAYMKKKCSIIATEINIGFCYRFLGENTAY